MVDLVIRNGLVVDGTGAPAVRADVAVDAGRVVEVGAPVGAARREIDATDLVVAPGFIDVHTHFDAQVFWDPTLSPSPQHGVTTVVAGNCGFGLAPLAPGAGDYLRPMLARVEGMPLASLEQGVPWDWSTMADYLDRLDGTLVPNAGFLVGHSTLRRNVLGDDAVGGTPTAAQVEEMRRLLAESLEAGALGLSSSWSRSHHDHEGNPVPSRHASVEEILALCAVVAEHPGTSLEFIPDDLQFGPEACDLLAAMSRTARRPLNWNVLQVYAKNRDTVHKQLAASDYATERGGRVVALTLPDSLRMRLNFQTGFIFDMLPGWDRLMALPDREKLALLADPAGRAQMASLALTAEGTARPVANWGAYEFVEISCARHADLVGRSVASVAAEWGREAWDVLAEVVVDDELATVVAKPDTNQDAESWRLRGETIRDARTVVGASDAGAHLDMIDSFSYCTTLLAKAVREHGVLGLEEGIHALSGAPAALYGLRRRGTLVPGSWADVVVLDPATVGPGPVATRHDLPAGAARLYGVATGIHHVLVNGEEVVAGDEVTAARPGRVLRSGRDTETVPVGDGHRAEPGGPSK